MIHKHHDCPAFVADYFWLLGISWIILVGWASIAWIGVTNWVRIFTLLCALAIQIGQLKEMDDMSCWCMGWFSRRIRKCIRQTPFMINPYVTSLKEDFCWLCANNLLQWSLINQFSLTDALLLHCQRTTPWNNNTEQSVMITDLLSSFNPNPSHFSYHHAFLFLLRQRRIRSYGTQIPEVT